MGFSWVIRVGHPVGDGLAVGGIEGAGGVGEVEIERSKFLVIEGAAVPDAAEEAQDVSLSRAEAPQQLHGAAEIQPAASERERHAGGEAILQLLDIPGGIEQHRDIGQTASKAAGLAGAVPCGGVGGGGGVHLMVAGAAGSGDGVSMAKDSCLSTIF